MAKSGLISLSDELGDILDKGSASVVGIYGRRRIPSTGIHWKPGIVLTANHTLRRDEDIVVILPDGSKQSVRVAGRDPSTDLAILKIDAAGMEVAQPGDPASIKLGQFVVGLARFEHSGLNVFMDVVSAVGGPWHAWRGGEIEQLIRVARPLPPGFSGGPLLDLNGRVLGMNTSALYRTCVTVPANTVERVIDQLATRGGISRGYLGVGLHPIVLPESLSVKVRQQNGMVVLHLDPGGPAEKSGMIPGDILIKINGIQVTELEQILRILTPESIGKPITAGILRGGQPLDLSIIVEERTGQRK